jgi:benzoyl-CoA reductase/2-hydroxyglutaryl-CoA dehydratase subunit BcrC/BadD/HgdB
LDADYGLKWVIIACRLTALYGFREKVFIKYSFFDLSQVFVYTMNNEYLCAARMVEAVHPMAQLTGNPLTMDAVKEGIRRKRALKRQTLKVVKMAKAVSGGDVALPWHEIVPSVPQIAEHIEALEADRRAEAASLHDTVTVEDGEAALARLEEERPKIYQYAFERYEDLLAKGELTEEEKDWIAEFKTTDEYKYSYTMGGQRHEG